MTVTAGELTYHGHPYGFASYIEFDATPGEAWAVLTDFGPWSAWNPAYFSSEGEATVGAKLRHVARNVDGSRFAFSPTVRVIRPEREVRWVGHLVVPGLFDGEHYFEIDDLGEGRVRLTQGENFRGLLVGALRRRLERDTAPQFTAMNLALAQRVATLRG
jgi:hypothetical protein